MENVIDYTEKLFKLTRLYASGDATAKQQRQCVKLSSWASVDVERFEANNQRGKIPSIQKLIKKIYQYI